jgi:hypothetical protein
MAIRELVRIADLLARIGTRPGCRRKDNLHRAVRRQAACRTRRSIATARSRRGSVTRKPSTKRPRGPPQHGSGRRLGVVRRSALR